METMDKGRNDQCSTSAGTARFILVVRGGDLTRDNNEGRIHEREIDIITSII